MTIRTFQNIQAQIGKNVFIDSTALVIGDVNIGDNSSIWPMTVVRGDVNSIRIGAKSNVQDGCVIHVTHASEFNVTGYPTIIGNEVTIGHKAIIHGCTIEDQSLVGVGAILMDGAHIEKHVIVAAGSLVPPGKRLISGFLWLGNPVKKIRPLTEKEIAYFAYSANYYSELKEKHRVK